MISFTHYNEVGGRYVDRKDGSLHRERMPFFRRLKFLILYNNVFHWLDVSGAFRKYLTAENIHEDHIMNQPQSAKKIPKFIKDFQIDMTPFIIDDWKTFNDFFTRKKKPEFLPTYTDED